MSWADIQRREDGERIESPAFVVGVDFDPSDPEEVAIVTLASGRHRQETLDYYRDENARLRGEIAKLTGE